MAKLKVLNSKGKSEIKPKIKSTAAKDKGKMIDGKSPVETDPQSFWQGTAVYAGDIIDFDPGLDRDISDAKEFKYRGLAEPHDAEAKKFFDKLEKKIK